MTICSEGSERGGGGSHGKGLHGTRTHNGERGGKKTPGLSRKAKWHKQGEPLALKMASKGW